MISTGTYEPSDVATTPEVIRGTFAAHEEELRWLAVFLTNNDDVAEACLIDACAVAQGCCREVRESLSISPTMAIVEAAISVQRNRIGQLAGLYEKRLLAQFPPEQLPLDALGFIVAQSDTLRFRLDSLCRVVLILCGIEKCTPVEVAGWLAISVSAVEAAYAAALAMVDIVDCESWLDTDPGPHAWN